MSSLFSDCQRSSTCRRVQQNAYSPHFPLPCSKWEQGERNMMRNLTESSNLHTTLMGPWPWLYPIPFLLKDFMLTTKETHNLTCKKTMISGWVSIKMTSCLFCVCVCLFICVGKSVISRLRKNDQEFQTNLSYTVRSFKQTNSMWFK